jgi:hypothetical protein
MVQRNFSRSGEFRPETPVRLPEPFADIRLIPAQLKTREKTMHGIIYIVGLIVVIMAVLSLFGLR